MQYMNYLVVGRQRVKVNTSKGIVLIHVKNQLVVCILEQNPMYSYLVLTYIKNQLVVFQRVL